MRLATNGILAAAVCFSGALILAADSDKPSSDSKPQTLDRAALEKEFAQKLTGATLVGRFTVDGRPDLGKAGSDRYEIEKAEKIQGDRWMITARVKYGKHDLKIPVPLDVLWAGDTPVMTLTGVTIPGLGTFTSRVMFYGDRYAGTWQHDAVGGTMFGRIEKTPPAAPSKPATPATPAS